MTTKPVPTPTQGHDLLATIQRDSIRERLFRENANKVWPPARQTQTTVPGRPQ